MSSSLFDEFVPATRAAWYARIEKDLRGKPLEDIRWHLNSNITLDPAYHPEDRPEGRGLLWESGDWEVGEYVSLHELEDARTRLMEALQGGVEAPLLRFRRDWSDQEWDALLKDVHPSMISIHFEELYSRKKPKAVFKQWVSWLDRHGIDKKTVSGSLDFDPLMDWTDPPMDLLEELLRYCREQLPAFRCLQVNGTQYHGEIEEVDRELAIVIAKAAEYMAQLTDRGFSVQEIVHRMQFSVAVGTSYFVEIAKLRALRLAWTNLMHAFHAPETALPPLVVHLAMESQTDDMHTNMIHASTQVLAGALGGADRIFVLPANSSLKEPSTSFTRRIARNVQHILKMESHVDKVADPLAGSYFVEALTDKLGARAWDLFLQIEADGGYMESRLI